MAGRFRSGLPLFRRAITAADAPTPVIRPTFANPELRSYATATPTTPATEKKVKVPLTMFGVSGNYASALYIAAVKTNALDKIESELLTLVEAAKKSPIFSQFMTDVSVSKDNRVKALTDICTHAKFSDITKNFLLIVAENGRLKQVERISQRFSELTMAHRGEVKAILTNVISLRFNQPLPDTSSSKDQGQDPPVCTQLPTPTTPIPIDSKLPPFFFHPPTGNQWLVPVRSPSEGLIYKPYTGPCPHPTASIMALVFETIPGPHFSSQSYLQPYGMPLLNASVANPEPAEQVTPFDANLTIPCRSSSGVVSEPSRGSEVQCSNIATSPDRFQGDILSLFLTTPSIQVSKDKCNDQQKVQVIKVVPHNPRLATESAARIFQSIQEERKKI